MLDSITINRVADSTKKQPFTVGHLAECLLFYGQVNAIVSKRELEILIQKCGVETLLTLLVSGSLKLHIIFKSIGAGLTPGTDRLNYGMYTLVGSEDLRTLIYQAVNKVYHNAYKSNIYTDQLLPLIKQYDQKYEPTLGLLDEENFTTKAFREVIKQDYPDYPIPLDLYYRIHQVEQTEAPAEQFAKHTFEVETNFNTSQFERDLAKYNGYPEYSVGANFLLQAAMSIQDINIAQTFNSELSCDERNIPIIQRAILDVDQYVPNNQEAILGFNNHILTNCPSVAEAIDSERQSFDNFMKLFERSQQFRHWIRDTPDDSDHTIINNYLKECITPGFTEGLAFKALKFVVVSAPIALNPLFFPNLPSEVTEATNLFAGPAVDEITSQLAKPFNKWKPNQFVDKLLTPFLSQNS